MNFERKINERLWMNKIDGCISDVKNISTTHTPLWKVQILIRKPSLFNIFKWRAIYDFQSSLSAVPSDVTCEVIYV